MEEKNSEYKKGLWTVEEDRVLMDYIRMHGKGKWSRIPKVTGLKRCGKSCRLRWTNYLSPGVKRGDFSEEENDLIIRLHNLLGNRWSLIAGRVPGRTDNQVKNHWNTHLSKKLGIKKGKNKVSASSQILAGELTHNCSISPSDPNSRLPQNCDDIGSGSQNIVMSRSEVESQSRDGLKGAQGVITMTDDYESSFWFPRNELNLRMDLLDESLDFIWHGL
ncbi:hypothetical protein PTKIN_Ptkin04bG0086400 [Pterospermum kingtungense]